MLFYRKMQNNLCRLLNIMTSFQGTFQGTTSISQVHPFPVTRPNYLAVVTKTLQNVKLPFNSAKKKYKQIQKQNKITKKCFNVKRFNNRQH